MRPIRPRRSLALLAVAAWAATVAFTAGAPEADARPADHPCPDGPAEDGHACVEYGIPGDGDPSDPGDEDDPNPDDDEDNDDSIDLDSLDECSRNWYEENGTFGWEVGGQEFLDAYEFRNGEPVGDDEVLWVRYCENGPLGCYPPPPTVNPCWEFQLQGPDDGAPVVVITPEDVREGFWFCAELWFQPPEVTAWPSEGTEALVTVPTFVEIGNWPPVSDSGSGPACDGVAASNFQMDSATGEFSLEPCIGTVCISVSGQADLRFDPGDGHDPIHCDPPTLSYDPEGRPRDQAALDHACTYSYPNRGSYTASVHVDWTVTWETPSGSGSYDALPENLTTYEFEREVTEVQTVVSDAELG